MTTLTADEIRSRVETDWNRIVKVLAEKVALQSISAKGITAEHMKRSAEFVADELRLVGVDTQVVQASNADGHAGAHGSSQPARISFLRTPSPCCSMPITTCQPVPPDPARSWRHRPVRGHRNRRPPLRPWLRR